MDVFFCLVKCSFWWIFLLGSVWLDYVGFVLVCFVNCVCSKIEINCWWLDDGNFFFFLEGQDLGNSNGNVSINIMDILRNIIFIYIENWCSFYMFNVVDMEFYIGF